MRNTNGFLAVLAVLAGLAGQSPSPTRAGITSFNQADPGAGPGAPHPNSDAAAASFDAAAASIGTPHQVGFSGLPLGTPSEGTPTALSDQVALTLHNTDHTAIPGFPFGISNASPNPVADGYAVTPGASQYLLFVPSRSGGTASLDVQFQAPIQAFGVYLTGVGTVPNDLHLVFNDGTPHDLAITGSASGGIQFFGFTDPGASIRDVTITSLNVNGNNRDVFGLDDIHYVTPPPTPPVPEPSAAILAAIGLASIFVRRTCRRG